MDGGTAPDVPDDATGGESSDRSQGEIESDIVAVDSQLAVRSRLQLWLTADVGIMCASGRVTRWADQSGHGRDATLQMGQLGPLCQVTPQVHTANGWSLPYFSAPVSSTAPNIVDETLDVDLVRRE
jgi:hypothetical protein